MIDEDEDNTDRLSELDGNRASPGRWGPAEQCRRGYDVEQLARETCGLDKQRTHWCDAVDPETDTPIEIKGCDKTGYFRLYFDEYMRLREEDGDYVFVVYDTFYLDVLEFERVKAREITTVVRDQSRCVATHPSMGVVMPIDVVWEELIDYIVRECP